jgi:predicted ArsR family transcriptional regulator
MAPSPGVQDTSIAAFESLDPEVKARREEQILEYVETQGGATCWEIERALGLMHQSASACITKLRKAGHLVDSGERRPTNTGRMAKVWRAAQ